MKYSLERSEIIKRKTRREYIAGLDHCNFEIQGQCSTCKLKLIYMDALKQVFIWYNKLLKDSFPEYEKIKDFLLIM